MNRAYYCREVFVHESLDGRHYLESDRAVQAGSRLFKRSVQEKCSREVFKRKKKQKEKKKEKNKKRRREEEKKRRGEEEKMRERAVGWSKWRMEERGERKVEKKKKK